MGSEDSSIGRVLGGRYRIVRRLGEGGMGSVYEAEHVQLGRRVAIKLLHEHHASSIDLRTRFEREARMLSQLRHPNVVTITDFGVEDGKPFLAMDLLAGRDLASILKDGRVPAERAFGIVRQILRGVAHAHARGLVHRDLKPHNVIVEVLEDGSDHVTVLDFGLARDLGGDATLTRSGIVVGTPAYMAPEQAGGGSADARADVYALGNVLFELLAGRRPFPFSEPHELVRAHLLTPAPSLRDTCHDLDVPAELEALVERALSKEPRDRYPDAAAMLAAIDLTPVPQPRASADPKRTMPARKMRTSESDATSASGRPRDEALGHAATERPPPMPVTAKAASRWRERTIAILALVVLGLGIAVWQGLGASETEPTEVAGAPPTAASSRAASSRAESSRTSTTMTSSRTSTTAPSVEAEPTDTADAPLAEANDTPSSDEGGLWSPVPEALVPMYERLASGNALQRHQERRLAVLMRRSPEDPRPAILLAHEYVRARSFTAALEPIEEAVKRDRRAVGNDAWAVADLVTLVASSATNRKAAPIARRAKSARMRAEVRARIADANDDDAARLRVFLRSLR
ncbi:MAG: serine/threonine protein kinase [Sandaracinus sp.]|nr:serine/threonine protein kinase [Sandaracinus sp.]MCB9625136.1 serine/threonine protein kinase [Sandaracinus sp.]